VIMWQLLMALMREMWLGCSTLLYLRCGTLLQHICLTGALSIVTALRRRTWISYSL